MDGPVDVIHPHDWHTGPPAIWRDERYADDPIVGGAAILMTLHNLAYHGWTPRSRLGQLGLVPGDGVVSLEADGIDLLATGIERSELANTVSPRFEAGPATAGVGGLSREPTAKRRSSLLGGSAAGRGGRRPG